jgi:hypothetical protein
MSTLLDEPIHQGSATPAAQRLRTTMAAVRISMSWFGTRTTLTAEQRAEAAEPFAAKMREFQEELAEAVETLDRRYSELKATARNRLGSL